MGSKKGRSVVPAASRERVQVPELAQLRELEERFAFAWPEPYLDFCRRHAGRDVLASYPGLRGGAFVIDAASLEAVNSQIGAEEWGDYERALVGKEHPKTGLRFWGGLVPFYYDSAKQHRRQGAKVAESIYGFPSASPGSAEVLVWSVHTIVHSYSSFDAWLEERRP